MSAPWERPSIGQIAGSHERRLRDLERKLGLLPNLVCDDMADGQFDFPWFDSFSPHYTSTFVGGGIALHQPSFSSDTFRDPQDAYMPPVIRGEWAEFAFSVSVDTLAGYTGAANILATIVGEATSGSGGANGLAHLLASQTGGVLTFQFGAILQQDPGPGSFANDITFSSLALAADVIYDVKIRARVTAKAIYSQLIIDEALLLDLSLANPVGGSGGLHETGCRYPAWGISAVGAGTPPTFTFYDFRYAINNTDRRPCATIESPHD